MEGEPEQPLLADSDDLCGEVKEWLRVQGVGPKVQNSDDPALLDNEEPVRIGIGTRREKRLVQTGGDPGCRYAAYRRLGTGRIPLVDEVSSGRALKRVGCRCFP